MVSYILRLYRCGNGESNQIAGLLEDVFSESQMSFRSFDELQILLSRDTEQTDKTEPKKR